LSGRESGREPHASSAAVNPDTLEVVAGFQHQQLEGWVPAMATPEELHAALEQAFDYRGDVLITRKDGTKIEGYIFDRRQEKSLTDSYVRLLPKDGSGKVAISYVDIAALAFTGRDMAAGKSWENWVKQYWEKKAAGETVSLQPEELE
jgi:hypothetical protein